MNEQIEILRRIAERGLALAQPLGTDAGDRGHLDLWQHMLDEIQNLKRMLPDV